MFVFMEWRGDSRKTETGDLDPAISMRLFFTPANYKVFFLIGEGEVIIN